MSEPAAVVAVIRQFADLFARVRRPFIMETPTAWVTRNDLALDDSHLAAHLYGAATFGVMLTKRRGGGRIATNLALEVDFGDRETPVDAAQADILGFRGPLVVKAVHDAGSDLDIPPAAWAVSWSGGRSLHFWLTPREPIRQAEAYTVAQAIRDGVDQRIAHGSVGAGGHQGGAFLVEGAVTHRDHVDRHLVALLDLGTEGVQRGGQVLVTIGGRATGQPFAEFAFLQAGQGRDLPGIVGPLLDQGQGLEDRVVEVGGQVGSLLGADPFGAFGREVADQPHPERGQDQGEHGCKRQHPQQEKDRI